MSYTELLIDRAREANERFGMFTEKERILVGFSGGADSLALLCVLHTLLGENVCAFHLNHMLRGKEADADELFCKNFCEERNIPFSSERVDVAAMARMLHGGGAIEETARDVRYACLCKESERVGASGIALAHTASDNTETVLFNMARGTALSGLRGIPPKRKFADARIIRPLILCTREEIEGYCEENGLCYRTDATNSDVHYRRNFIRHRIVPELREINPSLHKRVAAMCATLRADEDFILGEAYRVISENRDCDEEERNGMPVSVLSSLHLAVRTRVFSILYAREGKGKLEEKHFADIEKLLESGKEGSMVILPGRIAAVKKNGKLFFVSEAEFAEENEKKCFRKRIPMGVFYYGKTSVTVFYREGSETGELLENIAEFSKNAVISKRVELPESTAYTIYMRNREDGDKYTFGGMTRRIKKLLTGGTETAKKKRPVFCDDKGIFWFPPFRLRDDVYAAEEKRYILHYFEY